MAITAYNKSIASGPNYALLASEIDADGTISPKTCSGMTYFPGGIPGDVSNELRIFMSDALTGAEETALDAVIAAHTGTLNRHEPTFKVTTPSGGRPSKIEWFATDNGDGTYADLAKDEVYTYSQGKLVSVVTTEYYTDGTVVGTAVTESYYTTGAGKHVVKVT